MPLRLTDIHFTYEDAPAPALAGVTITFPEGWTGITGVNGSGKSTLMRIAVGELAGFTGDISPANVSGVYCPQTTEAWPVGADKFILDYTSGAARLRRLLGIEEDWPKRFATLSDGERKRLQIAVALWQNPPVLSLDEPTNHLDAPSRERLLPALASYRGIGLVVSHDRAFLDTLVGQCLFMTAGRGVLRKGGYSQGKEQECLEGQTAASDRKTAKAELGRLRGEQDRRRHEAARAKARRSRRHLAKGDSDGRDRIGLAIVSGQDGQTGKLAVQMNSRIKAAEERLRAAWTPKSYSGSFWLDTRPSPRKILIALKAASLPMGEERRLVWPELEVTNTARIGLVGPNGAGKSTLIRHLLKRVAPDVAVLYLPQEVDERKSQELLRQLAANASAAKGRILSLVARLNSDPDRILSGETLSPGELRKVMLATGILGSPELIILDEPTNHLDLPSIEAMEAAFADCPCALLLVSHDSRFVAALTTGRWRFQQEGETTFVIT